MTTSSAIVLAIVVAKPLVILGLARAFGRSWRHAVAAALCLAQVGEFSFVLAAVAQTGAEGEALMSQGTFRAMVSATIITLLLTPYLVAAAPWAGARVERRLHDWFGRELPSGGHSRDTVDDEEQQEEGASPDGQILIVGFGPAGQRVAEGLMASHQAQMVAVDLNPNNIEMIVESLREALTMSEEEQAARNFMMQKRLKRYDIVRWANDFMERLAYVKKVQRDLLARRLTDEMREILERAL